MIFVDESIQETLGYICVGFAYCKEAPDEAINNAITQAGLVPGVDEYKSGYRMASSSARHSLRESIYQIVLERCNLGVYIAPLSERPSLLTSTVDVAEQLIRRNDLDLPQYIFVDQGIAGCIDPHSGIKIIPGCDSRLVPGIQLADFVAYHCSYLLKCALTGMTKKIIIEDPPLPLTGEEVDLDWILRTDFRRHFFVEQRNVEEITGDDWFFKLAGFGAFFSSGLSQEVRLAAEETFDSMYFGCVW
ncbi:hypothetical protein ICHIJ1_13970 [Fluviibacter phosphoraccumulans]|uniref:DUF3800 domain-containing protein n=1 Tax=Fluviibacter phosphoraccumulans TaxID=1751046 RepID=UPI001366C63B|nr:DUF3800 domain-containing protein [Fluviibacter phosphoraccumulans]BBU71478.1 hypothetical protein ICHIJ1_13970 [Fluviibacter phosphoraccumulans]